MVRISNNVPAAQLLAAIAMISALLCACSDDPPAAKPPNAANAGSESSDAFKRDVEWLELRDGKTPTEWLAQHAEKQGVTVDGNMRRATEQALATASRRLGESQRMVANRAVQLETMLRAAGHNELAMTLIPALTDTIGEVGQTEGFGAVSQHYYRLRVSGKPREQALGELRQKYGPRQ